MIKHTFFDKCNTIIEGSDHNTGLNPVAELNTGLLVSRILIHFNVDELVKSVNEDGVKTEDLKHILKMTNCGGINLPPSSEFISGGCTDKKRASSFDVIAFKLPFEWDEGRGFDYYADQVKESHRIISVDGSNWYQAKNGLEWDEYGVYFNKTLHNEFQNKYLKGDSSIIIGVQHFDSGTENLEIDITSYVNDILLKKNENYGIGLAFSPIFEKETIENRFISFFTNHTNTFFLPYLETINNNSILDNRGNFHLGCKNRLYFFASDNGTMTNLDELPVCTINGKEYDVIHSGKGVYYIELLFKKDEVEPDTILSDVWSNIVLNGEKIDDIVMEFVTLPLESKVSLGKYCSPNDIPVPQLSGINFKEHLKIGDIREVFVDFIEEYSHGRKLLPNESFFRIYTKENNREIDIFQYQPIERRYDEHSFILNTNELVPNTYYIDIKVIQGRTIKHYENVLEFTIVSNVTKFYK